MPTKKAEDEKADSTQCRWDSDILQVIMQNGAITLENS